MQPCALGSQRGLGSLVAEMGPQAACTNFCSVLGWAVAFGFLGVGAGWGGVPGLPLQRREGRCGE